MLLFFLCVCEWFFVFFGRSTVFPVLLGCECVVFCRCSCLSVSSLLVVSCLVPNLLMVCSCYAVRLICGYIPEALSGFVLL